MSTISWLFMLGAVRVLQAFLSPQFCEALLFCFHASCTNELNVKGIDPVSSSEPWLRLSPFSASCRKQFGPRRGQ